MLRSLVLCAVCLLLSPASPGIGPGFARASSVRTVASRQDGNPVLHPIALTNTTNSTNATTTAPTPAVAPTPPSTPTPPPTHAPTKKYEPEPDEEEKEESEGTKVGMIFLWIVVAFSLIWAVCYFRDAILFFLGNAWNNTRRYGCKGCLHSFFPCFFGALPSGGGEPLDQIIFETEDPNAPLMT